MIQQVQQASTTTHQACGAGVATHWHPTALDAPTITGQCAAEFVLWGIVHLCWSPCKRFSSSCSSARFVWPRQPCQHFTPPSHRHAAKLTW